MKKLLFLIRDLGHGGAEKVLVNLVNHMNKDKFDITVMTLFDEGVNRQFLAPHIKYKTCFKKSVPGNSHLLKIFSPEQLHNFLIKDKYDIEIAYLEGPASRIISGCQNEKTKIVAWIHCTQDDEQKVSVGYRNFNEAKKCFEKFNKTIFVSKSTEESFKKIITDINSDVLYNTNDSKTIKKLAEEKVDIHFDDKYINIISAGRIIPVKGFDRLARIHAKLISDGYPIRTYILGDGSQAHKNEIDEIIKNNSISDSFTFLGYQTNLYKFMAKADLFVCSSYSEGFSTAATEALIVGLPVCTVEVSGMKELLGENNEYGIITKNDEDALYEGIKSLLDDPELLRCYKEKSMERGEFFSTEKTVHAVEEMLLSL